MIRSFGRLMTAMVTPFTESGAIDFTRAGQFAEALVKTGSDGLVVGGTTGESPSMSNKEKLRLFASIKENVGDSASVIAGTTDNNTRRSVKLSEEAEKDGVDGILMTVPSYNKPTQEGLYLHFKAIAESVSIPCILYNVPSRTALNMEADTSLRLAELSNMAGIKEASSDPDQINFIIANAPENFLVWSGNDNETFSIMAAGGYGVVSVASNIIGLQVKNMMNLIVESRLKEAAAEHLRLLPLFKALFWITNPIPVRYTLNKSGFAVGPPRLPMTPAPQEFREKFDSILLKYSIDIAQL